MTDTQSLAGQTIRGYQLKQLVGAGGFGQVYRAHQPSVDRSVAIKVILPEFTEHPDFVARFEAEARTVAKLEHPHIVPLYDFWQDEHGAFLVMRYLKGGSLRDRLEAEGALDPEELERVMGQVCEALAAAHEHGVVHRDLKPENILLDQRGQAYLTDFGIAKDLSAQALTQTGKLTGSAGYLAPEQARAEPVSPATDVYALGILAYELLTGEHPFPDLTPIQLIQHQLNEPLPPASDGRPGVSADVDAVIQRATEKDPANRPADVQQWMDELRAALSAPARPAADERPEFLTAQPPAPRPLFVGREADLEWLDRRLAAAIEQGGRVAFVSGGPGRGKTSLVNEFAYQASKRYPQLVTAIGSANAFSGLGDPYLPFRDILAMLTGEAESKWAAGLISSEQARRLWSHAPHAVAAVLDHGPELLNVFVAASELEARGAAAQAPATQLNRLRALASRERRGVQQTQLFEQYTGVLRSLAAERPLVLVVEDLQWADGASISLLFHLGRRLGTAPVLIVGTYREEEITLGRDGERHPLEKVVAELRQLYGEVLLQLDEVPADADRAFLEALLNSEPNALDESFRQALFERTGGHPLFTVELLRSMQERGDLVHDESGSWVAGPDLSWDRLPERVEAVIQERVARLEEELRELLSVASVEGEQFTAQVVGQVQQVRERQLLRQLSNELERRHRLVHEQGEVRAGAQILSRYRFSHQLFQRYLYNELSAGERRLLHREVASTLELLYRDDLDQVSVQLARHFEEAGEADRAAEQLMIAGRRARRLYANPEALSHFDHALELSEAPTDEMLRQRAEVLNELYRGEQAVADYQRLLDSARQRGDRAAELAALLGLARGHYVISLDHPETGAPESALRYYEQAHQLALELDDIRGVVLSLVPTVWFTDFWPDYEDQARANAEEALAASQSIEDERLRLEAGLAMFYTDPYAERPARGRALLEQLEAVGDLSRLNYLLFGLMFTTLGIGEFEACVEHCERGIALADKLGVPPVQYPTIKGIALARLGRIDAALASLDQEVADEAHRLGRAFREIGRAIVHFELQDLARTIEIVDAVQPLVEELARAWMQDALHMLRARAALQSDRQDEIELDPTLEYLRGSESTTAAVALGEYALASGDSAGAHERAERGRTLAERRGRRPDAVVALELLARIELARGDPAAALESARAGLELAEATGYQSLLWKLRLRQAEALEQLGRPEEADRAREHASKIIRSIAATVSDEALGETFLASPAVRAVLEKTKK